MIASFNDVFNNNEEIEKKTNEIFKRAIEERWCCTCSYYKYECDGDWCKLGKTIADGTCPFYDLSMSFPQSFDNL